MRLVSIIAAAFALCIMALPARSSSLFASFGMMLPGGGLTDRADYLGSALLPGPQVGAGVRGAGAGRNGEFSLEGAIDMAFFRSDEDTDLKILYVPVQAAVLWEAVTADEAGFLMRLGLGPGFVSANIGDKRSTVLKVVSLSWQIRRAMSGIRVAVDAGADFLLADKTENMIRLRLVLLGGGSR